MRAWRGERAQAPRSHPWNLELGDRLRYESRMIYKQYKYKPQSDNVSKSTV